MLMSAQHPLNVRLTSVQKNIACLIGEMVKITYEINLFGAVEVTCAGQAVTGFRSQKTLVLLAYLILEDRPITRDYVAGLLWPDIPHNEAMGRLRRTLHNLTTLLPGCLEVDRRTVYYSPAAPAVVDVRQFASLTEKGDLTSLTRAVALATAPFLEGVYLADSAEMESWIVGEQERWQQQVLQVLERITTSYTEQGAYQQALTYAQQWVRLAPWHEEAHRQVMALLAQTGQPRLALAQYEICRRALADELGVEVATETTALYEAIRSGNYKQRLSIRAQHEEVAHDLSVEPQQGREPIVRVPRDRRAQQILLNKVKSFWVEGVLENSLHGAVLIELGLEARPAAVAYPWELVLLRPGEDRHPLPEGCSITDVFEETGQALLILGEPGSGKTTMLLELARHCIQKAEEDDNQPIPVVFNLSSWQGGALTDWLVEELNEKYLLPRHIGQKWVATDQLLLLLDGLDEVKRERQAACIEAINAFRRLHGLTPIAVCSRVADYEAVAPRLRLQSAVLLQSLSPEQVELYLAEVGPELKVVRTLLQEDTTLQELARTPLMLSIMTLAYRGLAGDQLEHLASIEARRQHLFATYVTRMFERRGLRSLYPAAQTVRWLAWLAGKMKEQAQTVFLIEGLQPGWLESSRLRWLYLFGSRVTTSLISGLIGGIIFGVCLNLIRETSEGIQRGITEGALGGLLLGFLLGLIEITRTEKWINIPKLQSISDYWKSVLNILIVGVATWITITLWFALVFGLSNWLNKGLGFWWREGLFVGLWFGLSAGIIIGLRANHSVMTEDIQTVESLRWSVVKASKGGTFGIMSGLVLGLIYGTSIVFTGKVTPFAEPIYNSNLNITLTLSMIGALFGGLIGAVFGGLQGSFITTKTIPNQGIRLSLLNSIIFGLLGLVIGAIIVGFTGLLLKANSRELMAFSLYGTFFGLLAILWYGGFNVVKHYTLRLIIWRTNTLPWNYAAFLDYAAERIFLRKVGGGYIFVHRLLLEYFAELEHAQDEKIKVRT